MAVDNRPPDTHEEALTCLTLSTHRQPPPIHISRHEQVGAVLLLAGIAALARQTQTAADDAVLELVASYAKGGKEGCQGKKTTRGCMP